MPRYVVTPWKFHRELVQVRRELYHLGGSSLEKRQNAVNLIQTWSLRGNLPHAIESTGLIMDVILHHEAAKVSEIILRTSYAASVSRFVTGFCDMSQDGAHKVSMYDVAREIDMPASFVELRHEATHEELPSLLRLSRNAKLALDWLWQYYWVKIDDSPRQNQKQAREQPVSPEDLQEVLDSFMKTRKEEIKIGMKDTTGTGADRLACIALVRKCLGTSENLMKLATLLVKEKRMVPAERSLHDSMKGAFEIWNNLLRRVANHQRHFLKTLVSHIVGIMTIQTDLAIEVDTFREALYEWLIQIFSNEGWQRAVKLDEWELRETVVKAAVMDPNHWLILLAKMVFQNGSKEFKGQWGRQLESVSEDSLDQPSGVRMKSISRKD